MSKETDELKATEALELLERVATALPVLEAMLKKAAELTRAEHDMGASRARDMLNEVREFLKPKDSGRVVVSGVHPQVPVPLPPGERGCVICGKADCRGHRP